jgi:hypothetical protein
MWVKDIDGKLLFGYIFGYHAVSINTAKIGR